MKNCVALSSITEREYKYNSLSSQNHLGYRLSGAPVHTYIDSALRNQAAQIKKYLIQD